MSEFDRHRTHRTMPKPVSFPERGLPEIDVLSGIMSRIGKNIPNEQNFSNSYAGPPHPFAKRAYDLGTNFLFVSGWGDSIYDGTAQLEKEAVRMVSSLLNLKSSKSVGFINSGGTESNILAVRMAKLVGNKQSPELVVPNSAHFSFDLAGHLMGIRIRRARVKADMTPDMDHVEQLITKNTVGLVCSAPEGSLGVMDPISEFSELAIKNDLYLHVDSAFGGFILPFMRSIGYKVPSFDFKLPGVSSMMTDSHKLGLVPIAASFLIFRDSSLTDRIPTEETLIHTITSTKNGGLAAAAWGMFQHLGRQGYEEYVDNLLKLTKFVSEGISEIDGLALVIKPYISVIGFTADRGISLQRIQEGLVKRRWGISMERTPEVRGRDFLRMSLSPMRTHRYAQGFLAALEQSVKDAKK